jgi:hypothetical protein
MCIEERLVTLKQSQDGSDQSKLTTVAAPRGDPTQ